MILIEDGVLTEPECTGLKWFFEACRNEERTKTCDYTRTEFLDLQQFDSEKDDYLEHLTRIHKKIVANAKKYFDEGLDVQWSEITKREIGVEHPPHWDYAQNNTCLTSITYLNEDYFGGETYFYEDMVVHPKKGKTIYFNGQDYLHGVNSVKNGARYVLTIWYHKP